MRLIAFSTLRPYSAKHPETEVPLTRWTDLVKESRWTAMSEIQAALPKSKVINSERVRFEICGGDYRLIAAVDFNRSLVFVKFIGTHAEYDRIDALTVAQF